MAVGTEVAGSLRTLGGIGHERTKHDRIGSLTSRTGNVMQTSELNPNSPSTSERFIALFQQLDAAIPKAEAAEDDLL